eukprot:117764_1
MCKFPQTYIKNLPSHFLSFETSETLQNNNKLKMPYKKHNISLTKAGRVRSLTPTISKQIKKKRMPIGRAKKRYLYIKRFCNSNANANKVSPNASPYKTSNKISNN